MALGALGQELLEAVVAPQPRRLLLDLGEVALHLAPAVPAIPAARFTPVPKDVPAPSRSLGRSCSASAEQGRKVAALVSRGVGGV